MSQSPVPGWYTDPTNVRGYRWWDGQAWSEHVSKLPAPVPAARVDHSAYTGFYGGPVATAVAQHTQHTQQVQQTQLRPAPTVSAWERNRYAFITLGIVAAYIFLAMKAHVYVLGILPVMMSARSHSRKEPLAVVAIVASVVAVILALRGFTGH